MKLSANYAKAIFLFFLVFSFHHTLNAQGDSTYAERLGFPKGKKVVILHVDDAGMSFDSNTGVEEALTSGVATSCSVMMPCSWVPGFVHFLKAHPGLDAGLHLTLTSEWKEYRWGPLSGAQKVPGLVDPEGDMWPNVADVVAHASADEVEQEIRAQLARALGMGFRPTHLDSHMGTLFARPDYLMRYIKVGEEFRIPVMLPGGHNTLIQQQMKASAQLMTQMQTLGRMVWNAGLPVLDDLHNESYDWKLSPGTRADSNTIRSQKTAYYIKALASLRPGLTMMIMHCTRPTAVFSHITDSGITRQGDLLAMLDPALRKYIREQGIILTSWHEVMERRLKAK